MFRKSLNKGFSLVELLVVITIIAILSVAAYSAVGGQTVKAKNSRRLQDISTIQSALEMYYVKNGEYPDLLSKLDKNYLSAMPKDPKTKADYKYWRGDGAGADGKGKTTYVLGATLEEEDTTNVQKAYMVGNDSDYEVPGKDAAGSACQLIETTPESTTCFPYLPVAP